APALTPHQAAVLQELEPALGRFSTFLLHGVTGSGKTEVYLRLIAAARALGKGALVLVPEIALTPQLSGRFRARFGDDVALVHSGLSQAERHAEWTRLRRGDARICVGVRSAIFAPVRDLAVIVVDEEHDGSFKQDDGPAYHARDLAVVRGRVEDAVVLLGSATPSLESLENAARGRYRKLELPARVDDRPLPEVRLVDLTRLRRAKGQPLGPGLVSPELADALTATLDAGQQSIVFLNRRGYETLVVCELCGEEARCTECSVSLTHHARRGVLVCHTCGHTERMSVACPACGGVRRGVGVGTEQVEEALRALLPRARVARLDRDTATGRTVEAVLDRLRRREVDVLVGTQMVTKGHDLPGVTLVGVVLADQSLAFPDFRAGERTFQLLAQVAGRAGRGERPGRVVFQTFQPEHPAIRAAAEHDYEAFYDVEIADRRDLAYPPFGRMIAVRVDAVDEGRAKETAAALARIASAHPGIRKGELNLQGPAPAPIARLRGRFRYRFLVRGERAALRQVASKIAAAIDEGLGPARASVDVDPSSML
ncbi:MAG: primosomal protein N', partial [Myxococcales bacterium]|nr:primosomal protein N' [Myxococcales bacterium]